MHNAVRKVYGNDTKKNEYSGEERTFVANHLLKHYILLIPDITNHGFPRLHNHTINANQQDRLQCASSAVFTRFVSFPRNGKLHENLKVGNLKHVSLIIGCHEIIVNSDSSYISVRSSRLKCTSPFTHHNRLRCSAKTILRATQNSSAPTLPFPRMHSTLNMYSCTHSAKCGNCAVSLCRLGMTDRVTERMTVGLNVKCHFVLKDLVPSGSPFPISIAFRWLSMLSHVASFILPYASGGSHYHYAPTAPLPNQGLTRRSSVGRASRCGEPLRWAARGRLFLGHRTRFVGLPSGSSFFTKASRLR